MADQTLRVLPLGGLGEIGKNMTVVEYDGKLLIVDCGVRFPTAEMVGIDLVLPDFSYLEGRVDDIEGIVITHGHEDHLGALPWMLREMRPEGELPPLFGAPLTMAMARSKLDEHKIKEIDIEDVRPGDEIELGPFTVELIQMTHSIPDAMAVAITTDVRRPFPAMHLFAVQLRHLRSSICHGGSGSTQRFFPGQREARSEVPSRVRS